MRPLAKVEKCVRDICYLVVSAMKEKDKIDGHFWPTHLAGFRCRSVEFSIGQIAPTN